MVEEDSQESSQAKRTVGRCFEIEAESAGTGEDGNGEQSVTHYYIEILENNKIALELIDEKGEPTGEIMADGISAEVFYKRFSSCSMHECSLQPKTIEEVKIKMAENRTELGEESLRRGELDLAEDYFQRALKFDEDSIRAKLGTGKVHMEQDAIDDAMEIFNKISESNAIYEEENKHILNDFGIYLRKKDLYDLAIDSYEKAIGMDEKDYALYFNLGKAYATKGDFQKGIEKLKEALLLNPDFPEAKDHLAIYLAKEKEMLDDLLK